MADLVTLSGPAAERTFAVASDRRFVIGRDDACNLVLDDTQVSRRHAYLIELEDGAVEVGDLGSSNGTFVNGHRLKQPTVLKPGDSLAIGETRIRLDPSAADPTVVPPTPAPAVPPPPASPAAAAAGDKSRIRRLVSGDSSMIQRLKLERSVRRATLLAAFAVLIGAAAITAAVGGVFSSDPEPPPTASEIIAEVAPSTVRILAKIEGVNAGSGTGWVYDAEQGLIVTNAHVLGDQGSPGVTSFRAVIDGHLRPAELYADSPCYDLAMLQVQDPVDLETLPLGSQADLALGDQVNVVGYPGNEFTNFSTTPLQSTTGTISVVEESLENRSEVAANDPDVRIYPNLIQTDAAINHGNSGGPLVDSSGNLVGINTLTALNTQGQGFAIGVDFFKEQAETLSQGDSIGFLGFDFVAGGKGLLVNNAVDGTPAADAGFGGAASVVTAINGTPVPTRAAYCRAVADSKPGEIAAVSGLSRTGRFSVKLPFL